MEPIAVCVRADGEWALGHLAVRPLAQPPFPLKWLSRL
jgi:hypothetical protein